MIDACMHPMCAYRRARRRLIFVAGWPVVVYRKMSEGVPLQVPLVFVATHHSWTTTRLTHSWTTYIPRLTKITGFYLVHSNSSVK